MKKSVIVLLVVMLLVVSSSCAAAPSPTKPQAMPATTPAPPTVPRAGSAPSEPSPASPPVSSLSLGLSASAETERMTVRTGDVRLVVEDIATTMERVEALAESAGGYVVSSRVWREGNALQGEISIRVPVEEMDKTLKALSDMAVEVISRTTDARDVTEEYVDLEAQLDNLEATEAQLRQVMQKAEKVEDILSVQKELERVGNNIERTKGRMQYLESTSETSLIRASFQQSSLQARVTANKGVLTAGENVLFEGEAVGGFPPYTYEWDFGDRDRGTGRTVVHSYDSPGDYSVALKVTDDRGNTATETRQDYITVRPGWDPGNVVRSAGHGFVVFGQILVNILIWLAIFSPVWAGGGAIAYFVYRRSKKRAKGKAA